MTTNEPSARDEAMERYLAQEDERAAAERPSKKTATGKPRAAKRPDAAAKSTSTPPPAPPLRTLTDADHRELRHTIGWGIVWGQIYTLLVLAGIAIVLGLIIGIFGLVTLPFRD